MRLKRFFLYSTIAAFIFVTTLTALFCGKLSARASSSSLVVSEVLYDPTGNDAGKEWIEFYNLGGSTLDLSNYKVGDEEVQGGDEGMYQFPGGATIFHGQVVVVAYEATTFFAAYGFNPDYEIVDTNVTVPDMLPYPSWSIGNLILDNTGDELLILDDNDAILDALSWGTSNIFFDPPAPDVMSGHSLERRPADVDTDTAADWIDQDTPNPGQVTLSPTPTATDTVTPTYSPTETSTSTLSITPTSTSTDVETLTPSETTIPTATATITPTSSPTVTPTQTPISTLSVTPTSTPTITETPTPSETTIPTATDTKTPSPYPTKTPTQTQTITPSLTPTTTITPTPTHTNTHTPTVTITPSPTIPPTPTPASNFLPIVLNNHPPTWIFQDDFSSHKDWAITAEGSGWASIQEEKYLIYHYEADKSVFSIAPMAAQNPPSYSAEVDVYRVLGEDIRYGIVFDWLDNMHFYMFLVTPSTQSYTLYKYDNGYITLTEGTSPRIYPGDSLNHLTVLRDGINIGIYANYSLLTVNLISDDTFTQGQIGLVIVSGYDIPAEAAFDDFGVMKLP